MGMVDNANADNLASALHNDLAVLGSARVLHIPEILAEIFAIAPPACTSAARVCKSWSEIALDNVWRSLPCILPLLQIMGPLEVSDDGWVWVDPYQDGDWPRLWSYANRVRHIIFTDVKNSDEDVLLGISAATFLRLLVNLPDDANGIVLPNLQSLQCTIQGERSTSHVIPLLSPKITTLDLDLASIPLAAAHHLLRLINKKLRQRLKTTTIRFEDPDVDIGPSLADFFREQSNLESVMISHRRLPIDAISTLSHCHKLRSLRISTHFLIHDERLQFLNALVASCPSLEELNLSLVLRLRTAPLGPSVLVPLLSLHNLMSLRLAFGNENLSDEDIMPSLGLSWSRLEILRLPCNITLLPSIGAAFGKTLRKLETNLSFDGPGRLPHADAIAATAPHLKFLLVGLSRPPKDRAREVAEFLAVFSPNACIAFSIANGIVFAAGSEWEPVIETMEMVRRIRRGDSAHRGDKE